METKLEMQDIQYMNLFSKITKVQASNCFKYNSHIVFVVKAQNVMRAVGSNGINVKRLSERIGKKIKIAPAPRSERDIQRFTLSIVHPVQFKHIMNNGGDVTIQAGGIQPKAMLIGRESSKLNELKSILKQYFKVRSLKIA